MTKQDGIYYHVAGSAYVAGDDLLSWNALAEHGIDQPWKWEGADEGFDGDLVCLFDTLDAAREFLTEFGGETILKVDLREADNVRLVTNSEGYTAALRRIPAEYVTVAE